MKIQTIFIVLAVLLFTGCATTYQAPNSENLSYTTQHKSDKISTIAKAKRTLILEGFQIQSFDDEAGIISTSFKNWRLSPEEANCGTTMGIDYLKDNRTKTEVAFNIVVDDTNLTIRSIIQGEYKPGAVSQDITLTCVSRGIIERQLASKF